VRVVCARLCRWQLGHGGHRKVENKSEAYQSACSPVRHVVGADLYGCFIVVEKYYFMAKPESGFTLSKV
jgi:hypothetical protein